MIAGRQTEAEHLFRQTVETKVTTFAEYTGAEVELGRVADERVYAALHNAFSALTGKQDYSSIFPIALPGWTAWKVEVEKTKNNMSLATITRIIKVARLYTND